MVDYKNKNNIESLSTLIVEVHQFFKDYALRQVNNSLTLRNWLIGFHIIEFEQKGENRAEYGEKILITLSEILTDSGVKGFSERNLQLFRQFYIEYPLISNLIISKLQLSDNQHNMIPQFLTAKFIKTIPQLSTADSQNKETIPVEILVDKLSFTHFVELMKMKDSIKRTFYEWQTIKNGWKVKDLQRNMNSLLYERIGISRDKEEMLSKLQKDKFLTEDLIKNPYLLEFLNLPEKAEYSESDLEQSIIDHLQSFLVELGRGFCFEARQKRISFNNRHYKIDLVFYHRILKCHILIDLKLGEFDHSDAGQMNMYLNYFKENELTKGDNPPVGIILCSSKDNALVHYATGNLPQEVFVSQYMLQMPAEEKLKQIIIREIESRKNK